ncbi:unnamed protein product [Enterobius vermicularis]|uniref:Secreted protein n=1 Tax=Enterobius vermicularis TaxID=51028 RepID=A0A0N4VFJ1_ENTVE|nr:unnamed protein product [Enterobius vermicularis]
MFLATVFAFIFLSEAYPVDHDPFNPIGPWFRHKPPCGLPSFVDELPTDAAKEVKEIWKNFKGGLHCGKEHQLTKVLVHSLPEEVRHRIFSGRCGPSFLRNSSATIRNEFRNVWFNHRLTIEQKELRLKKLAFSLLRGESLALFYKWEEELQNRKTELAEKVANLSPDARDALEKWKELKFKETEFLAGLPKHILKELKSLCQYHTWNMKVTEKAVETSSVSAVSTKLTTTTVAITETTTATSKPVEQPTTSESTTSEDEKMTEKEFALFLDSTISDVFSDDAECTAFA